MLHLRCLTEFLIRFWNAFECCKRFGFNLCDTLGVFLFFVFVFCFFPNFFVRCFIVSSRYLSVLGIRNPSGKAVLCILIYLRTKCFTIIVDYLVDTGLKRGKFTTRYRDRISKNFLMRLLLFVIPIYYFYKSTVDSKGINYS